MGYVVNIFEHAWRVEVPSQQIQTGSYVVTGGPLYVDRQNDRRTRLKILPPRTPLETVNIHQGKQFPVHRILFLKRKHRFSLVFFVLYLPLMLCYAVACPHLERSGMSTACSRSASAHLYHAGSRLLPCDGAAD